MNEFRKKSFFRYLLLYSLLFSSMGILTILMLQGESTKKFNRSIVYNLKTNFELNHFNQNPNLYLLEQVIINSQFNATQKYKDFIPYQGTKIINNEIKGNYSSVSVRQDRFQNNIFVFTANLSNKEAVSISNEYEITINDFDFESTDKIETSGDATNTKEGIFNLYSNQNDTFYQGSNQKLIDLSYEIVGNETDLVKIARKIVTWISNNIEYGKKSHKFFVDMSWGALRTIQSKKGICWDFSELMVTLLRIQNIPARTVIGFVLDKSEPMKGDVFEFYYSWKNESYESDPLILHAWVEYFVPKYGWLACDPTWSDAGLTYFNELDVIHIRLGAGAWFSMPTSPFWEGSYLSFHPTFIWPRDSCEFNYMIKITVMKVEFLFENFSFIIIKLNIIIPLKKSILHSNKLIYFKY